VPQFWHRFGIAKVNEKERIMKNLKRIYPLLAVIIISMSSCIYVDDTGPRGRDGQAYFSVDYHFSMPYSYWDNNPGIPDNPYLGDYYRTQEGDFDFEYFINPYDYWYGTYSIYRNYGGPGGSYGEAGYDGIDTYLTLYCDPNGWHEDRYEYKDNTTVTREKDRITVSIETDEGRIEMDMRKANVHTRPSHQSPKWKMSAQQSAQLKLTVR